MNKHNVLFLAAACAAATLLAMPVVATAQPTDAAATGQDRRDAEHERDQAHRRDQQNRRDEETRRDLEHRQDAENRRDAEVRRDAEHRQDDGRGRGAALTADELIGHRVINRDDRRKVGQITDLVVSDRGQIEAAVVRTGGIFGLFTKDVAIPWNQIEHGTDKSGSALLIDMDKKALRRAPEYKRS